MTTSLSSEEDPIKQSVIELINKNKGVLDKQLDSFLEKFDPIINDQDSEKRRKVIDELSEKLNDFVKKKAENNNKIYDTDVEIEAQLIPYGSYLLGVASLGSDIDCVCIVPSFMTRDDFFNEFTTDYLGQSSSVTCITKVPDAFVPIISFCYDDIEMDLSFCILDRVTVGEYLVYDDDELLDGIDDQSVRSLNAWRDNMMLLKSVSKEKDNFRRLLRFLRVWAKKRGIYGNMYGFLGGINLALLSAWGCKNHQGVSSFCELLYSFFDDLTKWKWPEPIYCVEPRESMIPDKKNWEQPQNKRVELMPIITPATPTINSLRSATDSSFYRLKKEFNHARLNIMDIVNNMEKGISHQYQTSAFEATIQPTSFFVRYKYYIEVSVYAEDEEIQRRFKGLISSRVRNLASKIQLATNYIKNAFLFPHEFETSGLPEYHQFCSTFYIGVSFHENTTGISNVLLRGVTEWRDEIMNSVNYERNANKDIIINVKRRKEIPRYVFENIATEEQLIEDDDKTKKVKKFTKTPVGELPLEDDDYSNSDSDDVELITQETRTSDQRPQNLSKVHSYKNSIFFCPWRMPENYEKEKKPWFGQPEKQPDYFNYGFSEIVWEAYKFKQAELRKEYSGANRMRRMVKNNKKKV